MMITSKLVSGRRVVAEFAPMAGLAGMAVGILVWCAQQLELVLTTAFTIASQYIWLNIKFF